MNVNYQLAHRALTSMNVIIPAFKSVCERYKSLLTAVVFIFAIGTLTRAITYVRR